MIYFVNNNMVFEKKLSTELAALELLDRVLGQMDKHKIPINFHIDLSKAFDSLRHDILVQKQSLNLESTNSLQTASLSLIKTFWI